MQLNLAVAISLQRAVHNNTITFVIVLAITIILL